MSANLSVKDISEKKADSTIVEELVEKYESAYSEIYKLAFVCRIAFFTCFLSLISYVTYVFKTPDKASSFESFAVILSLMIPLSLLLYSRYAGGTNWLKDNLKFEKTTNKLEDSIVKCKLEERFGSNSELKDRIEDFYIELNSLTKAKYEATFRFYAYEFYVYVSISSLIAGVFIFRLL